jgi:exosortase
MRSLISLLAISTAFAFLLPVKGLKRLFIILSAIPIAIFCNAVRVIVTGFLAQYWGKAAAEGFFHEFAGLAVFACAVALLFSFGVALNRNES